MKPLTLALALLLCPFCANANQAIVQATLADHILPRFEALQDSSADLAQAAQDNCSAQDTQLRSAFGAAFDAWVSASHLRFGPTEVENRAYALAFWPDTRGFTPRSLKALIADQDPIAATPQAYAQVSVAARGFYALEFLLYDPNLSQFGEDSYRCTLIQTVTADIAQTTAGIFTDWRDHYSQEFQTPRDGGAYHTEREVLQELLKALETGLEFTSETRLARPLGTFDKPHPKRAESWRSGRSKRHVLLSLTALQDLAKHLSAPNASLSQKLGKEFTQTLARLEALNDPTFAGTAAPQSRLKIEVIKQSVDHIHAVVRQELGPELGVAAGFNSLDGD